MASNLPKLSLFALLFVALLASPTQRPVDAAAAQATTMTTNETISLSGQTYPLCDGEIITLSGQVHVVTHVTITSNGGTHMKFHQNFENVTATGTLNVITYRGVSSNNHTNNNNANNAQSEVTNINRVRFISPGPTDNFRLNMTIHTTINANGQATSTVISTEIDCQG